MNQDILDYLLAEEEFDNAKRKFYDFKHKIEEKYKPYFYMIRIVIFRKVDGSYSQNNLETEWYNPNTTYLKNPWDVFVKEHDVLFWAYFDDIVPKDVQDNYR